MDLSMNDFWNLTDELINKIKIKKYLSFEEWSLINNTKSWKQYYNEYYLRTRYWKKKSEEIKKLSFSRCTSCFSKESLCVHHKNYDNLWHEEYDDLIVLCRDCHSKIHNKFSNHAGIIRPS